MIKPEPEEAEEEVEEGGAATPPASPPVKTEPGPAPTQLFFPRFPLPLTFPPSPNPAPAPSFIGTSQSSPAPETYRIILPTSAVALTAANKQAVAVVERGGQPTGKAKKTVDSSSAVKQSFKCLKCGKCYNWNYNLNRHMRFECGIQNRFVHC